MTKTDIQLRGHCPCCGGLWATTGRAMSYHGYTVEGGWFQGACPAVNYPPIEVSRERADDTVAWLLSEAALSDQLAIDLKAGRKHPTMVNSLGKDVPWDEASDYHQRQAVNLEVFRAESRARSARRDAESMRALIERVHGKPLVEVKRKAPPPPIHSGERRVSDSVTLRCTGVRGARIYWEMEGERARRGWMSSRSWRGLPLA